MTIPKPPQSRKSPFDLVIAELESTEDKRSPFYQLLVEARRLQIGDGSSYKALSAEALFRCIQDLDSTQRKSSKTRRLAIMLQPFVDGLLQYTNAIDTVVQAGPAAAALVYGGAKLVLQLAHGFADCFDQVVVTLVRVGTLLSGYDSLSKVYDWSDKMYEILVISYRHILEFWQNIVKLFTRRGFKTFARGLGRPFECEWKRYKARLEEDVDSVRLHAQVAEATASRRREEERHAEHEYAKQENLRRDVLEWLQGSSDGTSLDVRSHLNHNLSSKHDGTCNWIFEDENFIDWKSSRTTKDILWLHGNPGTGKSVLSSAVVSELQSRGLKVVYFFCAFKDPLKSQPVPLLRSLATQLIGFIELQSQIPDEVRRLYADESRQGYRYLTDLNVASKVVEALLRGLEKIHVVIDGLDECDHREVTISTLRRMFRAKNYGMVKWLLTSRTEPEFRDLAKESSARSIEATKEKTRDDIRKFLVDNPALASHDENCDVIEQWLDSSDGNFLWAYLNLRILSGCDLTCDEEIELELARFPAGLTGCYIRTLQQLLKKPARHQELARDIFRLVVLAKKSLTLNEVADALAARPRKDGTKPEDHSSSRIPKIDLIVTLCCPLIVLIHENGEDYSNPTLCLAHKSIQDFFQQDPDDLGIEDATRKFFVPPLEGHLELGTICLNYLSYHRYEKHLNLDNIFVNARNGDHAFLRYAAVFWHDHLGQGEHSRELFDRVEHFIRSPNFWNCLRVQSNTAPYLLSRLTEAESGHFRMHGPHGSRAAEEDFYTHALPLWLQFYGKDGSDLIAGYTLFLKEWHHLLVGSHDSILQCHPGILGKRCVLDVNSNEDKLPAIIVLQGADTDHTVDAQKRWETHILSLQCVDGRIDLTLLEADSGSTVGQLSLSRWKLTEDPGANISSLTDNFEDRGLEDENPGRRRSCLTDKFDNLKLVGSSRFLPPRCPLSAMALTCTSTTVGAEIWGIERQTLALTRIRENENELFEPPPDIVHLVSNGDDSTPIPHRVLSTRGTSRVCGVAEGAWHVGSSDILERYEDPETEDSSESDEDLELDMSGIQTHFLVAAHGNREPCWFSWTSPEEQHLKTLAAFHPQKPLVVWAKSEQELLVGNTLDRNIESASSSPRVKALGASMGSIGNSGRLAGQREATSEYHCVFQDYSFSPRGEVLHNLTSVLSCGPRRTTQSVTFRSFDFEAPDESGMPKVALSSIAPSIISVPIEPTLDRSGFLGPLTVWDSSYVYFAINTSPSLASMKVFRISTSSSFQHSRRFEVLRLPVYLPFSSPQRSQWLAVNRPSASETEYIVFGLGPLTSSDLPPVLMIWNSQEDLGGWKEYDEAADGQQAESLAEEKHAAYLKGQFVDAEQRFSVPIRSGLDWTKSAFVSCW